MAILTFEVPFQDRPAVMGFIRDYVLPDQQLNPHDMDVEGIKEKQREFWTIALGGEASYSGRDLETAHTKPRKEGLDEVLFRFDYLSDDGDAVDAVVRHCTDDVRFKGGALGKPEGKGPSGMQDPTPRIRRA